MKLVGTILHFGTAYALYADGEPLSHEEIRTMCKPLGRDSAVVFGPHLRLVLVQDEPAPQPCPQT